MIKIIRYLLVLLLIAGTAHPQETQDDRVFSLKTAIQRAIAKNPISQVSLMDIRRANLDVKRARMERFLPTLNVFSRTGIVPGARGNIFDSPDKQSDLDDWGPFFKIDVALTQPLYTFGKITSAIEATEWREKMEKSKRDLVLQELSFEVVKAYWGMASTMKSISLAADLAEKYDELVSEVHKRLEDEYSDVDDTDYLEVKTYYYKIEEAILVSEDLKALSSKTFNSLLDLDLKEEVEIVQEPPPSFGLDERDFDRAIRMAELYRPEFLTINAAMKALEAKIDLAKGRRYPDIFLAGGFQYGVAGHREDQTNPFVVDGFNYRTLGAFLGIRWEPNFFKHNLEVEKSRAEYQAALENKKLLKTQIDLEVHVALQRVQKNESLLKAARKSLKAAKTWLRLSADNWELGIGEVRRVREAYQAYYNFLGIEIERENDYNVSLANLALALGDLDLYLKWVEDGKVHFD